MKPQSRISESYYIHNSSVLLPSFLRC